MSAATDVPQIISSQQAYAATWVAQANGFINQVASLANTQFPPVVAPPLGYGRSGITDTAKSELTAQRPARPTFPSVGATPPVAPSFSFSQFVPVPVLDFLKSSPVLNLPSPPSAALPDSPLAPTIVDPVLPDAPTVVIPVSPTVTMPSIPTPPSVALPFFSSTLPIDDLVAPTNTFSFAEQVYASALLDATRAKLLDNIQNGGYGIDPADDLALFERARARETILAQQAVDDNIRIYAARGFPLLPGDLSVAANRAQQALSDKLSSINRDIALKRADLFVDNRKFTITESREMETVLINYQNSIMERALNAAKATLDAALKIFDGLVARYNARVAAFQASAQVFEAQIRAALVQVEIYKTQVEAARLTVDVQRVAIDAYNAQLSGIQAVVGIFRTRMEAAAIAAQVQRLRLDVFRGLVDAYAQQVQAKVAQFNMYRAQIEGETAKVVAFKADVDAYVAQVEGAKIKTDIQVAGLNAQVEQARVGLLTYQAGIEQFKATLQSQVESLNATTNVYRADITAFATAVDALKAAFQLEIEELSSNVTWNTKVADVSVASAKNQLDALVAAANIRVHASEFGADFYQRALTSVLGSITTLAAEISTS